MKTFILSTILALLLVFCLSIPTFADMESENYKIPSSVVSGGGGSMSSTSYDINSTLGQPSPLMDPDDSPWSTNYYLYPGFQYTIDAILSGGVDVAAFALAFGSISTDANYNILCDFDGDGDVDGNDLAAF